MIRCTSYSLLFTRLQIAIGMTFSPAACQMAFRAIAVFHIAGLAARMTRSLL